MGILARILGRSVPRDTERRSGGGMLPIDPYWANFAATRGIGAASPDVVLSNLAVATRCVQLRSELLASVPLFLFRRTPDGGRERASDNPLYFVLHDMMNPNQSSYEGREFLVRCLDLNGNAYGRIDWTSRGQVGAIWPLLPGDVQVDVLPTGRLRYRVYNGRRTETLLQEEVLHIRGASRDGIIGWSPIAIARGALNLALAHQQTAQALSDNSLRPSGIVSFPQIMSKEQKDYFRTNMDEMLAGAAKAGRTVIVDAGAKYETVSFSPEDAQFLEQRKLANEDVARIFGMPPTSVGITDKATYSNTEQESRSLVQNCIGPLAGRLEAAMQRCLLTDVGRRTIYIEHDLDGLLRGDVKTRFDAYRLARETGVFSANDIRRKENEPPIGPEGDIYHQPANWVPLGTAPQASGQTNNAGAVA
jgi:HK97 family phage portal protein